MSRRFLPLAWLLLLCTALPLRASADEGAWWSYRDAYRALVRFEKLGQAKQLIQQRLQVQPLAPVTSRQGLRLSLSGGNTELELPLDAALHAQVPLLKSAYDDNAALRLNRPANAYAFRVRVSISTRADGNYPIAELRQACEQVLAYQRQIEPGSYQGRRCVGVSLAFAPGGLPGIVLRQGNSQQALSTAPGPLYPGEADRQHAVVVLRWSASSEVAQLSTPAPPLVIAALME